MLDTYDGFSVIDGDYILDPSFNHLRLPGINYVPGAGPVTSEIIFVGEAPGEHENEARIPFVGKSGKILEELLNDILGLKREDVYVTNVVKYRPMRPENRDPTPFEISKSIPYLSREINIIQPEVIVPLGRIATRAFYPGRQAKTLRGKVLTRNGRKVIPTYHPAAITWNKQLRPALVSQFEEIKRTIS